MKELITIWKKARLSITYRSNRINQIAETTYSRQLFALLWQFSNKTSIPVKANASSEIQKLHTINIENGHYETEYSHRHSYIANMIRGELSQHKNPYKIQTHHIVHTLRKFVKKNIL